MANGLTHRVVAATAIGASLLSKDMQEGKQTLRPIGGSVLAAMCTNFPDWLEPATNPHHRQFFHSLVFAGLIGWGMYKIYEWKPETEWDEFVRFCLLVGGASVLIHLAADSLTPRSLPLLGKIK